MSEVKDFAATRGINRFKLEEECERTPGEVHTYADLLADAESALDRQEEKIKYLRGETEISYRKSPPSDVKVTEGSIAALLASDEGLAKEIEIRLQLQSDVNKLRAVMKSLDSRKSELANLTRLWLGGYYTVAGMGDGVHGNETAHEKMRAAMNNRQEAGETQGEEF